MKNVFAFIIAMVACCGIHATTNANYSAPKFYDIQISGMNAWYFFTAPLEGVSFWESNFSNENPMGGLTLTEGTNDFYNGGLKGHELCEKANKNSYTLTTPQQTLSAGQNYIFEYTCAGTHSSVNKHLTVLLSRPGQEDIVLEEEYELAKTENSHLQYIKHTIPFSVATSADNYTISFVVAAAEKSCGILLTGISLGTKAPADKGSLKGYNIVRNGQTVKFLALEDVPESLSTMMLYEHQDQLAYSTEYSFALQAVYEGGESPLSATATLTTKADPNAQPEKFPMEGQAYSFYNYQANYYDHQNLYLNVVNSDENKKDVVLGTEPQPLFFFPAGDGYYIRTADGHFVGGYAEGDATTLNEQYISYLVPEVWYFEYATGGYAMRCSKGYMGFPESSIKASCAGMYAVRNKADHTYNGEWVIEKMEGTYQPTYEPAAIHTITMPAATATQRFNLLGQPATTSHKGIVVGEGRKELR